MDALGINLPGLITQIISFGILFFILSRVEGQRLVVEARETAERFREEEMAKVRDDIEQERVRAEATIQRERDSAIEDLRKEFAGLAISAAEKVVRTSLDEDGHKDLIESVLEESTSGSK